jgi:ribosomal protein S18 acetylase RimI-like enzyme
MEIRVYKKEDERAVVKLWREVFADAPSWNDPATDIRRKLAIQRDLFLVAAVDSAVVGTAMAGYDGHRGWVYYVAVNPKFRNQGIGRALMDRVEQDLGKIGCPKLNLQVRASDDEVLAFYRKLGYKVEARVSMAKRLPEPSE